MIVSLCGDKRESSAVVSRLIASQRVAAAPPTWLKQVIEPIYSGMLNIG